MGDWLWFAYNQVWSWVFGDVIAWYMWALFGIAGAAAIYLLLPAAVPYQLRKGLALLALGAGVLYATYAKGLDTGTDIERIKWERAVRLERERLTREFGVQQLLESARTDAAMKDNLRLQGEVDTLLNDLETAKATPHGSGTVCTMDTVVVSEHWARRMRSLRGRR